MKNIQDAALTLLLRQPIETHILPAHLYRSDSLAQEIEKACVPKNDLSRTDILNILVKYFYAYIYPDSMDSSINLKDISVCFNQFIHRRLGTPLLWDKIDLRRSLLKYGFSLAMLADLPKSAHIFHEIALSKIDPDKFKGFFLGIDIGAGTGILMLAQMVAARKNEFDKIKITGIERDKPTFERTRLIADKLNLGTMLLGDAKKRLTYSFLSNDSVTFISNETLPGVSARLWKEDFIVINKMLFDSYETLLRLTHFFPNQVYARDKSTERVIILNRDNNFYNTNQYPLRLMYPYAIELDNAACPLTEIGWEYAALLQDPWPDILSHRW
ncbi:hypothetical protein [Desulfonatronovibrio magnus]|uniref:hypothetical protein n=1 Tax=Desulfonatronovibrio magnus TaxID=698827 RepID=UPI000B0B25FA|nr:hypothetical protein [Desulfonatronovibrio magnus]